MLFLLTMLDVVAKQPSFEHGRYLWPPSAHNAALYMISGFGVKCLRARLELDSVC